MIHGLIDSWLQSKTVGKYLVWPILPLCWIGPTAGFFALMWYHRKDSFHNTIVLPCWFIKPSINQFKITHFQPQTRPYTASQSIHNRMSFVCSHSGHFLYQYCSRLCATGSIYWLTDCLVECSILVLRLSHARCLIGKKSSVERRFTPSMRRRRNRTASVACVILATFLMAWVRFDWLIDWFMTDGQLNCQIPLLIVFLLTCETCALPNAQLRRRHPFVLVAMGMFEIRNTVDCGLL